MDRHRPKCTKGIPCGDSCVPSWKSCQQELEQDRIQRMRDGFISRSPQFRPNGNSFTRRVRIATRTGETYELSTDRPHLAQRFYDGDLTLPEAKATVVGVRERNGSLQVTLQDFAFTDRFGRYVKEDHVNLFLRKTPYTFEVGQKMSLEGLEVQQYASDPERFGVRAENLRMEFIEDYAES